MNQHKNELIIRMAQLKDVAHLVPLLDQLGYPQSIDAVKTRFIEFTSMQDYGVAVAETNGQIVGFVAWSKALLFVSSTIRIRIEGLVVSKNYRNQGIGKKLMQFVEDYTKPFSPCILELTSSMHRANGGSHDFYKSIGYQNDGNKTKVYLRKEI